jgi:Uncharacterized conserved protein
VVFKPLRVLGLFACFAVPKNVRRDYRANNAVGRALRSSKRPLRELKRPLRESKRPLRELKRPLRELKRALRESKRALRELKRALRELKRALRELKRALRRTRRTRGEGMKGGDNVRWRWGEKWRAGPVFRCPGALCPAASLSRCPGASVHRSPGASLFRCVVLFDLFAPGLRLGWARPQGAFRCD